MNWRAKIACIKTSSECSRPTASKTSISFLRLLCFPLSTRNSAVRRLSVDPVFMICLQSSYILHFFSLSESPLVSPASISDCFARDKGPWIIKPVASSRGRGIYLVSNVSDFLPTGVSAVQLRDSHFFGMVVHTLVTPHHSLCPQFNQRSCYHHILYI